MWGVMSMFSTSHSTRRLSPPRIGSGQLNTGFRTQSDWSPGAWLVDDPSKPQMGRSAGATPSAMILVFERSLAVGSVPSIQMYSALYGIRVPFLREGVGGGCGVPGSAPVGLGVTLAAPCSPAFSRL